MRKSKIETFLHLFTSERDGLNMKVQITSPYVITSLLTEH